MNRLVLFVSLVAVLIPAGGALAKTRAPHAGDIVIRHPWMRPTPTGAQAAAAYVTLVNTGKVADRLIGGSTPVAEHFEIHQMAVSHGVMTMRPVEGGLVVPVGGAVELKPGGLHIMLTGLKRQLTLGETVTATLEFQRAGRVTLPFLVGEPLESSPAPATAKDKH